GCTYSSAIAAKLADGCTLIDSVKTAKKYIDCAIKGGQFLQIGHGHGPLNHMVSSQYT
ncbi:hydroxymethylpyrimidine/phosphomethylpyrimidine kinase, partial [Patescibacteria group bacterium]|nr:hydroxymethylpyrimidine/phosphomethylpyrimidine kinase [Patescibacteria group bacterium]MBU4098280.1 hydroxymethylpyrimidine/phosphomethylpyrimidine kinase [Patescibacteria group bacterium]